MDWSAYKSLCDSPQTFSRWMLEQSVELLADEAPLAERVAAVLRDTPLEKPVDHRGGAPTDMFTLALSVAECPCDRRRGDARGRRRTYHNGDEGARPRRLP